MNSYAQTLASLEVGQSHTFTEYKRDSVYVACSVAGRRLMRKFRTRKTEAGLTVTRVS